MQIQRSNLHGYGDPDTDTEEEEEEEEEEEKEEHEEEEEEKEGHEEEEEEEHLEEEEEDDDDDEESGPSNAGSLLDLPRDCLVRLISFLPPKEVCRVSSLCKTLRDAADSDDVWRDKVPIYPRPVTAPDQLVSNKKQTYFHLRSEVLQQWWSDPAISQGCFLIPAKKLHITWGDDVRYWRWSRQSESWFGEAAHLGHVCWLEISGHISETIFRPGVYVVSFRIMLSNVFGFRGSPIKLSLSTSNGQHTESERFFQGDQTRCETVAPLRSMGDRWLELDVGTFSVHEEMPLSVKFSLMEIEGGAWKRGLVVDCVKIQPFDHISGTFI